MHRLEIRVSSWCTHIFKVIEIVDGHLAYQRNQISKIWKAKRWLSNHIPVHSADWFRSWLVGNLLPYYAVISFLCLCFHFGWKYVAFTWLTCVKCSAAKSDENIFVKGERSIKAAQKDPSATVVTSIHSTDATVVGSVNVTEFWQWRTWPPSFLLLQFHIDLLFALAAKWFIIITVFATIAFVLASFTDVLCSIVTISDENEAVPWLFW